MEEPCIGRCRRVLERNGRRRRVAPVIATSPTPTRHRHASEALREPQGMPLKYTCAGVVLELESGHKVAVPFFVFSAKDQKILKPGWTDWLAAENDKQQRQQSSFLLRTLANAYQRNSEQNRQIQTLQLLSDWFDLWEVGLQVGMQATSVAIPARNSEQAVAAALSKYPGASVLYVRVLERRTH